MLSAFCFLLSAFCLLLSPFRANAQTVHEVHDFESYQIAIAAVNAGAGGDIIKITADIVLPAALTRVTKDVTITAETNPDGTPKFTLDGMDNSSTYAIDFRSLNCSIENLIVKNTGYGIYFEILAEGNAVLKIHNCICTGTRNHGIWIAGGLNKNLSVTVSNCTLNDNKKDGIHVYGNSISSTNVKIHNCIANNNTYNGIYIERCNVNINDCVTNNNTGSGIYPWECKTHINDCSANFNQRDGIGFSGGSVKNCSANNNGTGFYMEGGSNDAVTISNCTANYNTSSGFFFYYLMGKNLNFNLGNHFVTDCSANHNGGCGFINAIDYEFFNCSAENNGYTGFYYIARAENCIAKNNGVDGFWTTYNSIVNNCAAIHNGENGFSGSYSCLLSNSTSAFNAGTGFSVGDGGEYIILNATAQNNNKGVERVSYSGTVSVYNSIIYDNSEWDLNNDTKGEIYNSVYQTADGNSTNLKKQDCTTNPPNLIWLTESGEPITNPSEAAYYNLGSGSWALGLADKSLINRTKILETIFIDNPNSSDRAWFESIVTEEYLTEILMLDQRGNIRSFDGDKYDAGSMDGGGGTPGTTLIYAPKKTANYGSATITFYGIGFDNNTTISLKKQGENDIVASKITINSANKCAATFNLHNKKLGKWDIVVNAGGEITTINEGFELEQAIEPKIELELLGASNIRNGATATFTVKYTNTGNVSIYCQPILIEIITDNDLTVEVQEYWKYFYTEGTYTEKYAIIDGEFHKLDTLHILSGEGKYTTCLIPLIPVIPPYGTGCLVFSARISKDDIANDPVELKVSALSPLVVYDPETSGTKSIMSPPVLGLSTLPDCLKLLGKFMWDAAKTFIPGVGCGMQIAESVYSVYTSEENTRLKVANGAAEMGKVLVECGESLLPGGVAVKAGVAFFKGASAANDMSEYALLIKGCINSIFGLFGLVGSKDPNDKVGPVSPSGTTWLSDKKDFTYVINFENSPQATAPAQEVWIIDTLDLKVFDINSFEAGIMKMSDTMVYDIPFETQNYTWSIDMRPKQDLITEINLTLDKAKGIAKWYFKSIDPATCELPTDPLVGFLPPNNENGDGQGFVMFSIKLKEGVAADATIANRASIVFDHNAPILTPTWENKRDLIAPTSAVLRPTNSTGTIELKWQGQDNASGVYCYDIFMKKDNGAYELLMTKTKETSTTITIAEDVKYSFYAIATDNAGNREPDKVKPDLTIPFNDLPFDTYAVTKWNNTFMLNLRKLADDGYDVTDCKWYKNSQLIGEGFSYSAGPEITDLLETGAVYYFQINTKAGEELFSTNKILNGQKNGDLRAYPNPVSQGQTLTVEGTTQGNLVEVYNFMGICVNKTIATGVVTRLNLALPPGVYIVRSNNDRVKVVIH